MKNDISDQLAILFKPFFLLWFFSNYFENQQSNTSL